MQWTNQYVSPLGTILLAADEQGLTGLWFEGQKYYALKLSKDAQAGTQHVLDEAKRWLDAYFSGLTPDFQLPLHLLGTPFQNAVWQLMCEIPYGRTATYGELARRYAQQKGLAHMSAQAVGNAVGKNPISIIIPCHRVVGTSGSLTGYAGGMERKIALLRLEGAYQERFFVPRESTAPRKQPD